MNLTYDKGRGLHWWQCPQCGAIWPTKIPDQADVETETRPRIWGRPQTVKALGADGHTRMVEAMVPVARGTETVVVDGYQHNPGAPELTLCPNCNGGHFPRIRLVSRTPRRWSPNDHVDGGSDPSQVKDGHPSTGGSASSPHRSGHRLDGEWGQWAKVAAIYARKVPFEDRDDFRHDVIVELAKVKAKYQVKGKPLTEAGMMRVAAYERAEYWERAKLRGRGIVVDCGHCSTAQRQACRDGDRYVQCRKAVQVFSLYAEVGTSGDREPTELRETLADDQALDLDKWMDDRTWLASFPRRLVAIAQKQVDGIPLTHADRTYLYSWRRENWEQTRFA